MVHAEEPELVAGAALGGPVHTREPDDGPDDDADNPPDPVDDESRYAAPDGSGTDDVSDVPPMEGERDPSGSASHGVAT